MRASSFDTDSLLSHVWILFNFYIWHLLDVSLSIRFLSLCDKLQLSYRLEHSHSFYIQCYHKHVHHTVQNRSRKFVRTVIEFTWHVFIPSLLIREIIWNLQPLRINSDQKCSGDFSMFSQFVPRIHLSVYSYFSRMD